MSKIVAALLHTIRHCELPSTTRKREARERAIHENAEQRMNTFRDLAKFNGFTEEQAKFMADCLAWPFEFHRHFYNKKDAIGITDSLAERYPPSPKDPR